MNRVQSQEKGTKIAGDGHCVDDIPRNIIGPSCNG